VGENSKIEWTDHTFNPWWGCTKVSAGCANCYAETFANRFGNWWGPDAERRFFGAHHWHDPLRWNRKAERDGVRAKVFCGSMCDFLENRADLQNAREALYGIIDRTPMLDWLLLTKRPENFHMLPEYWLDDWPDNVWPGVTVEDSDCLWRIGKLLLLPAAVRFVSCEPLLGPIDLRNIVINESPDGNHYMLDALNGIGWFKRTCVENPHKPSPGNGLAWTIVGGESGPGARPMHPDWARSLRDQCQAAGVPYFLKQHGAWTWDVSKFSDAELREYDRRSAVLWNHHIPQAVRVGKKAAGRTLDGREWNEFPEVG
jgi:protein gp37